MKMKMKMLMLMPLMGLISPAMATDATGEIAIRGSLLAPTCMVSSPTVAMGSVIASSLEDGSNEQRFQLTVRCDLTSEISAITFSGNQITTKPDLFAVTNSAGTSEPNANVGLRLQVDTDQSTTWGDNAIDNYAIHPNSNLLDSLDPVLLVGSGTATPLMLKVAMVTGHEGVGSVDVHGEALSTPINVTVTY